MDGRKSWKIIIVDGKKWVLDLTRVVYILLQERIPIDNYEAYPYQNRWLYKIDVEHRIVNLH